LMIIFCCCFVSFLSIFLTFNTQTDRPKNTICQSKVRRELVEGKRQMPNELCRRTYGRYWPIIWSSPNFPPGIEA
jgi:hypothetical protein